ncbi:hypothetical protein FNF27_02259 [Cafeteria roenbergensis]|uniref:Cilia- and flagella-associated protein 43 n=2 Tax=Cafeteria roenbergensis TaxID=33653 RepID=A0A5A8EF91_CAFRO|nr:hypothetical protein FNF27_02259 [Cafeteria roenbergensis]
MAAASLSPLQPSLSLTLGLELGLQSAVVRCDNDGGIIFASGSRVVLVPPDAAAVDAAASVAAPLPSQRLLPQHPQAVALAGFDACFHCRTVTAVEVLGRAGAGAAGPEPTVASDAAVAAVPDADAPCAIGSLLPRGRAVASTYLIPEAGGQWQFPLVARFPVSSHAPVHCVAVSAKALQAGGTGPGRGGRRAGSPLLAVMTGHPDARITIWECATGRPLSTCGLQPASIGRKLLFNPNDVTQLAALIVKPPPPSEREDSPSKPAAESPAASARPRLQRQASFGAGARIASPPRRAAQAEGAIGGDDDSPAELRQSLREEVPLGSVRLFRLPKPLPGASTAARRTVQAAFDAAEAAGEAAGLPDLDAKAPTLSESAAAAGLPASEASKAALESYPALQGMPPALPLTDFCWDGEGSRLVLLSAFARVLVVADGALAQEVCPLGPAAAAAVEDSVLGPVGHPLACEVAPGYRLPHWSTLPGAPDGAARAEEAEHRERKAAGKPLGGATVAEAAAAALRWGRLGPPTPVTPEIQVAGCHARGVAAVDVAAAGSTVVTAGRRDGTVVVWELALRRPLALRCYGPGSDPVAVACHQTGGRIIVVVAGAAAGAEELVVAAGASLVPQGPLINGAPAYCAKYGSGAAAGMSVVGSTRAAVVYSVGGARGGASAALAVLIGHTGPVVAAEFVRGGGAIATAGDDGSVFLFSAADFGEPATSAAPITRRQLEAAASSTTPGAKGAGGFLVTRPLAVVRTAEAPLLRGASHVVQMAWVPSEETSADVGATGLDPGLKSVVLATPLTATHVCRLPPLRRPDLALEALDRAAGASAAESEHLLRGGVVVWGATEDGAVGPLGVSRAVHAPGGDSSADDLAMHAPGGQGKAVDKVEAPTHSRVLPPDRTLVAGARWARPHAGPVRAVRAAADGCCIVSAGAVDGVVAVLLVEGATLAATGSALQLPLLPDTAVRAGAAVALGMDARPRRGAGARAALAASVARSGAAHGDADSGSDEAEVELEEAMWPAPALTLWEARQSGLSALLAGGVASLGSGGAAAVIASAMGEGGGGGGGDGDDGDDDSGAGAGDDAFAGAGGGGDGLRGSGASGGLAGAAAEAAVHFGTPGAAVVAVAAARWERERSRRQQLEGEIQDQVRAHHYELQDAVAAERARLQAEAKSLKAALELETRGRAADREDFESRDNRLRAEAKAAETRRLRSLMDLERRRAEAEEQARNAVTEAQTEAEEERLRSLREVSAQMAARQASETHIASRFEDAVVAARKEREEALTRVDDVRVLLEQELSQQADAADQAVTQSREEAKRAQAEARKSAVEGRVALKAKDAALAAMEAALARAEEAVEAQRRRADAAELKASEHAAKMAASKEAERRAKASASDLMQMLADSRERTQAVDATRKMALGELEAHKGSVQPREALIVRLRKEADGMAEEVTKAQAAAKRTRTALSQASAAYKAQLAEAKRARRDATAAESTLRRAAALVEGLAKEALGASGADDGSRAWRSLGTRLYRMLVLGDESGAKEQNPEDVDSDEDETARARAALATASLLADPLKARRSGQRGQRRASRPPVALPAVGRGAGPIRSHALMS